MSAVQYNTLALHPRSSGRACVGSGKPPAAIEQQLGQGLHARARDADEMGLASNTGEVHFAAIFCRRAQSKLSSRHNRGHSVNEALRQEHETQPSCASRDFSQQTHGRRAKQRWYDLSRESVNGAWRGRGEWGEFVGCDANAAGETLDQATDLQCGVGLGHDRQRLLHRTPAGGVF